MKTGFVTTLLALAVAGVLAAPASSATPTERKLSAQIKTIQRQVKVLQGQVRTLRTQMRQTQNLAVGGVALTACSIAATSDAFQGTWETIDGINAHLTRPDQYPPLAPIADPLNSCNGFDIQRQPGAVPPTTNVFAALLNIFR